VTPYSSRGSEKRWSENVNVYLKGTGKQGSGVSQGLSQLGREEEEDSLGYERPISKRKKKERKKTESTYLLKPRVTLFKKKIGVSLLILDPSLDRVLPWLYIRVGQTRLRGK